MKKILVLALAVLLLASCMTPVVGPTVVTQNFTVLGRVTVDSSKEKGGYTGLVEKALKEFPNADDVINVVADGRVSLFGWSNHKLSGVVVKYK